MIYFSEDSRGLEKAELFMLNLKGNTATGLRRGLTNSAKFLQKKIKDGIKKGPKTGRFYKYKGKRRRASAAGEYPANRSGNLRRGIGFQVYGFHKIEIGAQAKYAGFLELGTYKMKPRKLLKGTVRENYKQIYTLIDNSLKEELS